MAEKVIMPKQGLQMTEGTIIKWLVQEGGECKQGQPLFEMETDKLTIEIESHVSGKLLKIVRKEGETVPITETIAVIGQDDEDISKLLFDEESEPLVIEETDVEPVAATVSIAKGDRVFISPRAKELAQKNGIGFAEIAGSGPEGYIIERDIISSIETATKATPLAKVVAAQNDVELGGVQGTGARGKISAEDVLARISAKEGDRRGTIVPFAGMRKVIANRMLHSQETAAQTSHKISVDMTQTANLRDAFKAEGVKVSYNDIVSFVVCRALIQYPMMNSELTKDGILQKDYVNLGIAVALDDGLIVPVIKNADLVGIEEIAVMTKDLAQKAKSGKLKPSDYKGGSFTISNLGMLGLDSFVAIINQPESGILAIGAIKKTPVVMDDEIVIRPMMALRLSYDHRIVDGAPAAQFLAKVKTYLEQPYLLL